MHTKFVKVAGARLPTVRRSCETMWTTIEPRIQVKNANIGTKIDKAFDCASFGKPTNKDCQPVAGGII